MFRKTLALACSLTLISALGTGCSDASDDDAHGGAGGGGGGQHEGGEHADCEAISSVCHDEDSASEEAHDCHELAHENDAEVCAAEKERCVTLCNALAGGGGAGGQGGAH